MDCATSEDVLVKGQSEGVLDALLKQDQREQHQFGDRKHADKDFLILVVSLEADVTCLILYKDFLPFAEIEPDLDHVPQNSLEPSYHTLHSFAVLRNLSALQGWLHDLIRGKLVAIPWLWLLGHERLSVLLLRAVRDFLVAFLFDLIFLNLFHFNHILFRRVHQDLDFRALL